MKVRRLSVTIIFLLWMAGLLIGGQPETACAISPNIVISQVYGGGGNSGATYTHDFIELFNRGTTTVSLAGWSVQYASATGTGNFGQNSSQITELPAVSLAPGKYLLIQEAPGIGGTTLLPTPDVTNATPISIGNTGGKVALVNTTTPLNCNGSSTPCPPTALATIVDLVGWGDANFFEGSPAPATSNTTAIIRSGGGSIDTDNNASDFAAGAPTPRNTTGTAGTLCTYKLSQTSGSYGESGGSGAVSVTAPAGCPWTAASNAAWIAITSGWSGRDNGTVNYSVSANTSTSARSGTMTIAGQTFTVTQSGITTCTYILSALRQDIACMGGSYTVNVTAPGGCAWTAASNSAWITITAGTSGSGNGTVNYSVSKNTSTSVRSGTLTISGQPFKVDQTGVAATCTYQFQCDNTSSSHARCTHGWLADTGYILVSTTTGCGCPWTATSHAAWIKITSVTILGARGGGRVDYSISANRGKEARVGIITVAGQNLYIKQCPDPTQTAISCPYQ